MGGQVDPRSLARVRPRSLALTACTRTRTRHSTTLLPGTRASFGTRAAALARHPLAPPNRRMPRCTMSSMPARTLATADKMELRMVTQGSTIGASSSSFSPQPFSSPVKRLPPCDRGVPAGSTSKWRASSAAGGRPPWTTVTPSLRLRFRHLTTSDITRLAAHAAVSSRFVGRLEQRATLPHERQHGRRGQQLPLRLRRGHLLRLTRREPPLHPSRALTLATPCTHSQPAARQAAQDGARAPRRVRRVGVLRSVHTRFVGRGRVAQALPRSRSASIAPYTAHSHPAPTASTAPSPPHTPRTASSTSPPHTLHVSVRCRLHPRRMASSRTPTRGSSFARCPSYQAQAHAPAFVYPFARRTAYTPPLLATSGHPVARDQLDQAGQDRRDQLLLLASRPVVLPHTRLGSGSHMHSIFTRQVQALLYLLLALY